MTNFRKQPSKFDSNIIGETKLSKAKNGVKIKATNITVFIDPTSRYFKVDWILKTFDNKGNITKSIPKGDFRISKDIGAFGTVEFNEDLTPKLETFLETHPEKLAYSNWHDTIIPQGVTVGQALIGGAIRFVEYVEGIV